MPELAAEIDALAAQGGFSGVVHVVDGDGHTVLQRAYGLADRALGIPNEATTRFGLASGTKGLTALVVLSLVEEGVLSLATTARSLLGDDLPLVAADVTVEHLLAHTSGIGDYVDEDVEHDIDDHVLTVPVHRLESTEDYLLVLDGFPAKFPAGERFAYCNGGYVVLALLAERASATPFAELVRARVCEPAGMADTAFLRADELPAGVARGYLGVGEARTNVFHLPVLGSGDGGIYATAADVRSLWTALFAGRIVPAPTVAEMTRPRGAVPEAGEHYGLGLWLDDASGAAILEGMDAGVSFRSMHHPGTGATHTVIGNTSDGVWPLVTLLDARLRGAQRRASAR